ncbi:Glycosyltransferase involved in cell wall bisynthesis [Jannaschia faecimaris]|uniref:Glycosyltransferase involved in cell wall bisynthesis n=1 Tax=Jannaschia faecimaris TaxID=1244108 RepID=A0A1H3JDQ9_9RHOB|nr:glycosyltransferase family 4 protein [Jannaschia faecimaris]SDY37334.1 Glycosyltransferase involved in cell wall bisynthesis [Jannaschia faecimaris]
MKLIVFAHRLELGETQIDAIEMAAALCDRHGFDVVLHAAPGPALEQANARGLRYAPAPDVRLSPTIARMRALRDLVRREEPDLIHAWDWWQGLEAYIGTHLTMGVPLVISDMMMSLTGALPRDVPTTFGFPAQQELAQARGWRRTDLLPSPVNLVANAPNAVDAAQFRRLHDIALNDILLVSVSRPSAEMGSDALIRAIRAVRHMGTALPLRLLLIGDGPARTQLRALADEANEHLGRLAVILTGPMADPRPAYAASDVVLGMGASALRGLAFAKPVIVVGGQGFARIFDSESAPIFLRSGLFGKRASGTDNHPMADAIGKLAWDPELRRHLADTGLDFVTRHHGLDMVTDRFAQFCHEAVTHRNGRSGTFWPLCRTAFFYLRERRFRVAARDTLGKV